MKPAVEPRQEAPTGPRWRVRGGAIDTSRPVVVGILNVTPDSFSDGGNFLSCDHAVARAGELLEGGADVIDVGGESTRPQGAVAVDASEERRRVVPVIAAIRARWPQATLSVDTVKSEVACAALDAGAHIINDVSGFRLDPRMPRVCAEHGAGAILMHSRGGVATMGTYADATYGDDVVGEVLGEVLEQVEGARQAGMPRDALVIDPGIGFAKRSEHSLALLAAMPRLAALGYPVMVGVSRKRFIGEITGVRKASERDAGTTGANVSALLGGARLFRVHDARQARHALDVAWAVHSAASRR